MGVMVPTRVNHSCTIVAIDDERIFSRQREHRVQHWVHKRVHQRWEQRVSPFSEPFALLLALFLVVLLAFVNRLELEIAPAL
jgi:hypothetical protein